LGTLGGVGIGLAVGWIAEQVRKRTADVQVNVTTSLLTGYAAYSPADAIGASGVVAAVTAGIFMGIRAPRSLPALTRLQGSFVWDIVDFVVNAILFVLIGMQLRSVIDGISGIAAGTLAGYAIAVTGVVIATRVAWFLLVPLAVWAIDPRPGAGATGVRAPGRLVVAWAGMRGAVSLAVALAIPLTTNAGQRVPQRDLIIFLTFAVIFATLIGQGLTLPALLRRLGVRDESGDAEEEIRGRLIATKAALGELDALAEEDWTREETIERLRRFYEFRQRRFAARAGKIEDTGYEDRTLAYQHTLQRLLVAQRAALLQLRDDGQLSNAAMNRIVRELDLEESRLEI
jgi:CPA1 family monovalent cation:H+ antiporter